MRVYYAFSLALLMLTPGLGGQEPPAGAPPVVLRSTTRLVEVNVVVQDKRGRFILGLDKEDFILKDEGKPQEIRVFSFQSRRDARPVGEAPRPGLFSNSRAGRAAPPGGVTVILLDSLNTTWVEHAVARRDLMKYLLQIQPQDRVGLYALGPQLRALHEYTQDAGALVKAMAEYLESKTPGTAASAAIEGLTKSVQDNRPYPARIRRLKTLNALEAIANHLAGVPGRKNLVWVSGSSPTLSASDWRYSAAIPSPKLPSEVFQLPPARLGVGSHDPTLELALQRTVHSLNAADVAVYPVDARGLSTNPHVNDHFVRMKDLASETGGKAYYNRNDLVNSIHEAVEDCLATYTLAYYPSQQNLDGRYRRITVNVNWPGVVVRHRLGYFDMGDPLTDEKAAEAAVREALWSPLDATAVDLEVQLDVTGKPDPHTLGLRVKVAPGNVTLERRDGRWVGKVEVAYLQTDEKGGQYEGRSQTISLELQQISYDTVRKQGVVYQNIVRRHKKATTLRVVVRDVLSGNIGRVMIPLSKVAQLHIVDPCSPTGRH